MVKIYSTVKNWTEFLSVTDDSMIIRWMVLKMEGIDKSNREVQWRRDVEAAEGWDWQVDLNENSSEDEDLLLNFGASDCKRDDNRETAFKDAIGDFFVLSEALRQCNENWGSKH